MKVLSQGDKDAVNTILSKLDRDAMKKGEYEVIHTMPPFSNEIPKCRPRTYGGIHYTTVSVEIRCYITTTYIKKLKHLKMILFYLKTGLLYFSIILFQNYRLVATT